MAKACVYLCDQSFTLRGGLGEFGEFGCAMFSKRWRRCNGLVTCGLIRRKGASVFILLLRLGIIGFSIGRLMLVLSC